VRFLLGVDEPCLTACSLSLSVRLLDGLEVLSSCFGTASELCFLLFFRRGL
jgi:hypothetical protein